VGFAVGRENARGCIVGDFPGPVSE